jgi:predicted nucleic acid-binding protein
MITAVDSSVLLAIYLGESTADHWLDRLIAARAEGVLIISPVVAAEFYALVEDREAYDAVLADMGLRLGSISLNAACEAGRVFRAYRDAGGPREFLIPDFLIAAHAQIDCDRLAAADRGYLRRYFPDLPVLML